MFCGKQGFGINTNTCISENESIQTSGGKYCTEFLLDFDVIEQLIEIKQKLRNEDDDFEIYNYIDKVINLWKVLISKSIKCLRYFDSREPFKDNPKKSPVAYGQNELSVYPIRVNVVW